MKIVAFTGKMGSGKTTAIEELLSCHHNNQVNIKFAGPLYDIQEYIYDRIEQVYKRAESFTKDRKLLQWLGTEWGRETISNNLWVDLWKADAFQYLGTNCIVTCDDVRFDNEAVMVKSVGGTIIHLHTDSNRISAGSGSSSHASENGISPTLVDYTVSNTGTLEEFRRSLRTTYRELGLLK